LNRITLVLFLLISMIIVTGCGQYGALYAPTEEVTPQQSEIPEDPEQLEKQQEKSN